MSNQRVNAPVTASRAAEGVYTPPFQAVFTPYATPSIYGSPTAAPTQTADPVVTVTPTGTAAVDYAQPYLDAHRMSFPSYRYAYLFWCVIGVLAILYALAHHLRLSGGSLGAAYTKWGMRRYTIFKKRGSTLPSNSTMLVALLVAASAIVLCIVGNDYITPISAVWDFRSSKRDIAPGVPTGNISKSFWTSGSRFGFMAFALFPLVVLLALKAVPFAIFSIRPFTHLYADKLIPFHRLAGYLVWLLTTVHVALWTVQLFQDSYKGKAVWFAAWTNYHFIFGVASYACMTAMVVMSIRPVRKRNYEMFFMSHTFLGVAMLVTSILHHTVIWWWCAAALGLWAGDRIVRAIRYISINSGASSKADPRGGQSYHGVPVNDSIALEEFNDKMVHDPFEIVHDHSAQPEILPVGAYESRHDTSGATDYDNILNLYDSRSSSSSPGLPPKDSDEATLNAYNQRRTINFTPESPPIAPGYAQAQLLPSRTVRLTVRTPRPMKWSPGQYVYVTLPELSSVQSHPFTIVNNDPNEIVLLIKARKGITRKLYNLVKERSEMSIRSADKRQSVVPKADPVFIRTKLEGPHGSVARVRWREFSTVLVVCGGTGVSYGLSIVDHIARSMVSGEKKFETRRVRFVWVAREYAELAWAASALCRARRLLGPQQLQIDIYVTNANVNGSDKLYDDFSLQVPKAPFAGMHRNSSSDSLHSQMSADPRSEFDYIDAEMEATDANLRDLTQFEAEDDVHDLAQNDFSRHIQKEGKLRRAKTRKAIKAHRQSLHDPRMQGYGQHQLRNHAPLAQEDELALYPPAPLGGNSRPSSPYSDGRGSSYEGSPSMDGHQFEPSWRQQKGLSTGASIMTTDTTPYAPTLYSDDAHLLGSSYDPRRQTVMSTSDSLYGDPYMPTGLGRGPSPAPSFIMDDGDMERFTIASMSRTQSMVLLEDTVGAAVHSSGAGNGTLWIDEADYAATSILSESARGGRPKLAALLEEELNAAQGAMVVTTCGPNRLNTVVSNLVSRAIKPGRIRQGDGRGHVVFYSEDFET